MSNYEYITEEEYREWTSTSPFTIKASVDNLNKLLASKAQTGYIHKYTHDSHGVLHGGLCKNQDRSHTHIAHVFLEPLKPAEPECDHTIEIPHAVWPNDGESKVVWRIAELIKGDCFKCGKPIGGEK